MLEADLAENLYIPPKEMKGRNICGKRGWKDIIIFFFFWAVLNILDHVGKDIFYIRFC